MAEQNSIIIAGSTGLIGSHLVRQALKDDQIKTIISLSRHPLKQYLSVENKLTQIVDNNLLINEDVLLPINPSVGFIALGSTKKKAGSKDALRAIDVTLVVRVAREMKEIGVESIYVVSSIGASASANAHYLRCKGEMEAGIEAIGFERTIFVQPGPLAGQREEPRWDEQLLQGFMKLINPIMQGRLLNYKPIEANLVANAMLHLAFKSQFEKGVQRFTSQALFSVQDPL